MKTQGNNLYLSNIVCNRIKKWVAGFGKVGSLSVLAIVEKTHYSPAEPQSSVGVASLVHKSTISLEKKSKLKNSPC